jgi:hypothetical protein
MPEIVGSIVPADHPCLSRYGNPGAQARFHNLPGDVHVPSDNPYRFFDFGDPSDQMTHLFPRMIRRGGLEHFERNLLFGGEVSHRQRAIIGDATLYPRIQSNTPEAPREQMPPDHFRDLFIIHAHAGNHIERGGNGGSDRDYIACVRLHEPPPSHGIAQQRRNNAIPLGHTVEQPSRAGRCGVNTQVPSLGVGKMLYPSHHLPAPLAEIP